MSLAEVATDGAIPEWTIGDRMTKARQHAGLTQEQMAKAISTQLGQSISKQRISRPGERAWRPGVLEVRQQKPPGEAHHEIEGGGRCRGAGHEEEAEMHGVRRVQRRRQREADGISEGGPTAGGDGRVHASAGAAARRRHVWSRLAP